MNKGSRGKLISSALSFPLCCFVKRPRQRRWTRPKPRDLFYLGWFFFLTPFLKYRSHFKRGKNQAVALKDEAERLLSSCLNKKLQHFWGKGNPCGTQTPTIPDPKTCKSFPSPHKQHFPPKNFNLLKSPRSPWQLFPWIRVKSELRVDRKKRRSRGKDSMQEQGMEEFMAGKEFASKSGTTALSMAQQTSFDPAPGVTDKRRRLFLTLSFW